MSGAAVEPQTAETVAELVGPFLEEHEIDEAAVAELSGKIVALLSGGAAEPEPEPEPEPAARQQAATAQAARLDKLAAAAAPRSLASAVRIGSAKAATVDISVRAGTTRSDGSSAANELIEVASEEDDKPLALAASSSAGSGGRKKGRRGGRKGRDKASAGGDGGGGGGNKKGEALRTRPLVLPLQRLALCAVAHPRLGQQPLSHTVSYDLLSLIAEMLPKRAARKVLDRMLGPEGAWAWREFQIPSRPMTPAVKPHDHRRVLGCVFKHPSDDRAGRWVVGWRRPAARRRSSFSIGCSRAARTTLTTSTISRWPGNARAR